MFERLNIILFIFLLFQGKVFKNVWCSQPEAVPPVFFITKYNIKNQDNILQYSNRFNNDTIICLNYAIRMLQILLCIIFAFQSI